MASSKFGPFATVLESGEKLNLLLFDHGVQTLIDQIHDACAAGDAQRWVTALLVDRGWRLHLIAAVAYLLDQPKTLDCAPLWAAIDAGSWVIPQLVVTALFSDPEFPTRARVRVEGLCPVTLPPSPFPMRQWIMTPSEALTRSGKMLASILGVSTIVPTLAAREASWRANTRIQALLAADEDQSDLLASHWMAATTEGFLKRGIVLSPPSA